MSLPQHPSFRRLFVLATLTGAFIACSPATSEPAYSVAPGSFLSGAFDPSLQIGNEAPGKQAAAAATRDELENEPPQDTGAPLENNELRDTGMGYKGDSGDCG